ncbi:hypothetical protein COOONC_18171 [Cooperia oncophora]
MSRVLWTALEKPGKAINLCCIVPISASGLQGMTKVRGSNGKTSSGDGSDSKYVVVDIVAWMNCIRPRGPKFSVNRKQVLKLLDQAVAKDDKERKKLQERVHELEHELEKLKLEKDKPAAEGGVPTPPKKKRRQEPAASENA